MAVTFLDLINHLSSDMLWSCIDVSTPIYGVKRLSRDDNIAISPDTLYVMSLSDYRKLINSGIENAIVYSRERISKDELPRNKNIIVLFDKAEVERGIDYIADKLFLDAKLGTFSKSMQNCALSRDPFQSLLNYSFELLMNPIIVTDVSFAVIGKIGADNITDNEHWKFAADNGFFSQKYVDVIINKNKAEFEENSNLELIVDDKSKLGMEHNQYSSRLSFDGKVIGYIKVLEYNHDLRPMDREIIKLIAKYMSPIVARRDGQRSYTSSIEENFIYSILKSGLVSENEIELRRKAFGIKIYDNLRLVLIDIPNDVLTSDKLHFLTGRLHQLFTSGRTVVIDSEVLLLLDFKAEADPLTEIAAAELDEILSEYGAAAYISMIFHKLSDLLEYYNQTKAAREVAGALRRDSRICFYQDIIEYHMIMNFCRNHDYTSLLHPAILTLSDYDNKTASNLLESLLVINHNHSNLASAAREMFIHYNTLKYRLEKIVKLTGIDLDNHETSFQIALSEKVLALMGTSEPDETI